MRAALACLTLLIVSACGEDWRPPSAPTATPPATSSTPPTTTAAWDDLGEYTVTMRAAPSCSLPDYAMARTYSARLKKSGEHLAVEFDDPEFLSWGWPCGFTGTRDGDTVRFTLNGGYPGPDGYSFSYLVNGEVELAYTGTATGKMGDNGIAATLNGAVILYAYGGTRELARCEAPDHRVEVVRK
jgi:hypothetical protein